MSKNTDSINLLNSIMHNNEYFMTAITTDYTCRNRNNIVICQKTIELYAYLYKHTTLINKLFTGNIYSDSETLRHIVLNYMINSNLSVSEAVKNTIQSIQ